MPITLGSNISSLKGQRQLSRTSDELGTVFQRLSSGQRINKASDDAAGLAIADTLRVDARLYGVAMRNINDGLSTLSIIDGALEAQSQVVTRLSELAEQAANGTLSGAQRQALNKEYYALVQEAGRIGETTEFNGLKLLLAGRGQHPSTLALQAGISAASDSQVSLSMSNTGVLSGVFDLDRMSRASFDGTTLAVLDNFFNSGGGSFDAVTGQIPGSVEDGTQLARLSLRDSSGQVNEYYLGFWGTGSIIGDDQIMPVLFRENSAGKYGPISNYNLVEAITPDATGKVTGISTVTLFNGRRVDIDLRGMTFVRNQEFTSVEFTGVENVARAKSALDITQARIAELATIRGSLGAVGSRLSHTYAVAEVAQANFLEAESRIRDADIADENSRLVRLNILQQAAASVLAQANQQPALALQLLRT